MSSPLRFDSNPYASNGMQGSMTNDQVADLFRSWGFSGDFTNGGALNWAAQTGRLDDYYGATGINPGGAPVPASPVPPQPAPQAQPTAGMFSSNPFERGGMQGARTNQQVADWFGQMGYSGPFQGGSALNWAADQGYLDDYAGFIGQQQQPYLGGFQALNLFGGVLGGLGGLGGFQPVQATSFGSPQFATGSAPSMGQQTAQTGFDQSNAANIAANIGNTFGGFMGGGSSNGGGRWSF